MLFPAAPWVVCQTTVRNTEPPAWNKTKRSWRLVPAGIVAFAPVVTTQLIVIGFAGSSICVTRFGSVSVLPAGGAKPVTRLSPATSFTPAFWNVSTRPATVVVPVTVTAPVGTAPDTKNWACTVIGLFMLYAIGQFFVVTPSWFGLSHCAPESVCTAAPARSIRTWKLRSNATRSTAIFVGPPPVVAVRTAPAVAGARTNGPPPSTSATSAATIGPWALRIATRDSDPSTHTWLMTTKPSSPPPTVPRRAASDVRQPKVPARRPYAWCGALTSADARGRKQMTPVETPAHAEPRTVAG